MNHDRFIQSRDWCVVINNPKLNEKELYDYLKSLTNIRYFIFVREKGLGTIENPNGTEHHHCYLEFSQPKRFSTMKNHFSKVKIGVNAHIEKREKSRKSCVDYVKKIGNHKDKHLTQISQVYEYGDFSLGGQRNDLIDMVEMFNKGYDITTIFQSYPESFARYYSFIQNMSLQYKAKPYKEDYRNVEVWYIYGESRTGKTSYVYDKYGAKNIYSCPSYDNGKWFDDYQGQDVILLDEYRSNFDITLLLKYLDRYPLTIQCRYFNRPACFTKVYIVSNIPLQMQYAGALDKSTQTAFYNRIKHIIHFTGVGKYVFEKGGDIDQSDLAILELPIF